MTLKKASKQPQGLHLKTLVSEIRTCGVGFDVWELRNPADNKGTGKYDFTSLLGSDKKKNIPHYQKSVLNCCGTWIIESKVCEDFL